MSGPTLPAPWAAAYLIRSLIAGVVFIIAMLTAHLVLKSAPAHFVVQAAGALLGIALIVAAVSFVFVVLRKVMTA